MRRLKIGIFLHNSITERDIGRGVVELNFVC